MKNSDVMVKKSTIHGKGVFANRYFRKGEVVLRWDTSHHLTTQQASRLSSKTKSYLNRDARGRLIVLYSPERYVNHSDTPNTRVRNACDVATRTIRKGEEITGNYLEEADVSNAFVNKLKKMKA